MDSVTVRSLSTGSPIIDPSAILLAGSRVIGDVIVGKDASIWYNTVIRGDFGQITIGDRTNIQDNSMIHVTGGDYDTFIGNDVLIGHSCIIRSEEHTSELQSLMRISYAVFCLKKKK